MLAHLIKNERENELQAGGIFGHPVKATTMLSMSILGHWPASQLATPSTHAVGLFGKPAKSGAVTTPSTGFGAMPASMNFGGFASNTEPATSVSLFGSQPTKPMFGSSSSYPAFGFGGFGGTSTAGMIKRMSLT